MCVFAISMTKNQSKYILLGNDLETVHHIFLPKVYSHIAVMASLAEYHSLYFA